MECYYNHYLRTPSYASIDGQASSPTPFFSAKGVCLRRDAVQYKVRVLAIV